MSELNDALRAAREHTPSRHVPGEHMTRAELADAVNAYLWNSTGRRYDLDDHLIGKWERGSVRTPSAAYRAGLRTVLRAGSDGELGFDTAPRRRPTAPQTWSREQARRDGSWWGARNDRSRDGERAAPPSP